jgi:hypothetical protein
MFIVALNLSHLHCLSNTKVMFNLQSIVKFIMTAITYAQLIYMLHSAQSKERK